MKADETIKTECNREAQSTGMGKKERKARLRRDGKASFIGLMIMLDKPVF